MEFDLFYISIAINSLLYVNNTPRSYIICYQDEIYLRYYYNRCIYSQVKVEGSLLAVF